MQKWITYSRGDKKQIYINLSRIKSMIFEIRPMFDDIENKISTYPSLIISLEESPCEFVLTFKDDAELNANQDGFQKFLTDNYNVFIIEANG